MILVTGATGHFGAQAISHLLNKGINPSEISVLVRDATKAATLTAKGIEIRVGNYTDSDSLVNAFMGVDKLLLVSSNDRQAIENRTSHHINVIKAAKAAGVKHIIYTSFVRKPHFEDSAIAAFQNSHVQSEAFLKESGLIYTILQNGIYLEMIPVFTGDKVKETGNILFPAADGRASYVLRAELAEAAAYVLTTEGHEHKTYGLTNTTSVSFRDIGAYLSVAIGKEVTYQSPTVEEFRSTLKQFGVPDIYIGMFTMWGLAVAQGVMDIEDNTLSQFLGRAPTTAKQFINQLYG
jgi:NAD(P)H dehydrogenase (quinone)